MTLPVPAPTAPVADTFKHINDLRTAAIAAIGAANYVTFTQATIAANASGRWSYTVPGLTTVQGIVLTYWGSSFVALIVRGISGKVVTGDIWIADTGSNKWTYRLWGPGNFAANGYAWGVK